MMFSNVVMYFIMLSTGSTLFAAGHTDVTPNHGIANERPRDQRAGVRHDDRDVSRQRRLDRRVARRGMSRSGATATGAPPVRADAPGASLAEVRRLANQMFSRASGAPLREGNSVRLLKDAAENYPAWLAAIDSARHTIHFEMYIVHEDDEGRVFADALLRKASEGVRVRLLYDWLGGFRKTSRAFWNRLRAGGVDVRCYNPPRLDEPLGWLNRDHRKMIAVDGALAFVTGLCVGRAWTGDPARGLDPWRGTGVEVRGPAVADIEAAFAEAPPRVRRSSKACARRARLPRNRATWRSASLQPRPTRRACSGSINWWPRWPGRRSG
jgi:phosphatidylserine/phosphatidylglycerophosphate/cardiolipin synthase-like enzyme